MVSQEGVYVVHECILYAELPHGESRFVDTRGLRAGAKYIGFMGYVVGCGYSSHLIEETVVH